MKTGIIGATILITSTTIDDAIWLVPYTTSPHLPLYTKLIHGTVFVFTLEFLSILCITIYSALKYGLIFAHGDSTNYYNNSAEYEKQISFIMTCLSAGLCWSIAICLFIKKKLKKRRKLLLKQQKQQQDHQQQQQLPQQTLAKKNHHSIGHAKISMDLTNTLYIPDDAAEGRSEVSGNRDSTAYDNSNDNLVVIGKGSSTNSVETNKCDGHKEDVGDNDDGDINTVPTTPSIKKVISFTILGALDEISYFPALIMGNIFTPLDLCIGTFLASILILCMISLLLVHCKPLVDFLNRIPLHMIVGMFAAVLTIGLFV